MLFHSLEFLVFFVIYYVILTILKPPTSLYFSLLASYIFYSWWYAPYVLVLLSLSILAHYGCHFAGRDGRRLCLVIAALLTPLLVFKYTGFLIRNAEYLGGLDIEFETNWALPLGISFITFTAISYVVDAYQGKIAPERRFLTTALYISFFPQLIAGPILRARELVPQLRSIRPCWSMLRYALLLFTIGVTKKVVFADGVAPFVDAIYRKESVDLVESLVAIYGYSMQIYCDFSGYTDMALALAAVLGVRLPINFNRPYLASSIREFWHRWHMTLSRWMRDYLYIPIGGNKKRKGVLAFSVMTTMLLGGLWHGASWTFVIWGGAHGVLVIVENLLGRIRSFKVPQLFKIFITMNCVSLLWILFRSENLDQAQKLIYGLSNATTASVDNYVWPISLLLVFSLVHVFDRLALIRLISRRVKSAVLIPVSVMALTMGYVLGAQDQQHYIYFDF